MKNVTLIRTLIFLAIGQKALAQLPVDQEPHHKVVFENQLVRLMDLVVPPADTTLLHTHSAASAVVFLSESIFAIQNAGQRPVIASVKPGDVVYRDYDEKPVVHVVWTEDKIPFRCMVIEMKQHLSDECPTLNVPLAKLLWQQKPVNAYRLDFSKSKTYLLPKSSCTYVVINFSGIVKVSFSGTRSELKEGGFVVIPPECQAEVLASQEGGTIVLQLKSN